MKILERQRDIGGIVYPIIADDGPAQKRHDNVCSEKLVTCYLCNASCRRSASSSLQSFVVSFDSIQLQQSMFMGI
jgi:hypothetical protein